jgi:hypothetical protein
MLIRHEGEGCFGCPFFHYMHVVYGEEPVCGLNGVTPVSESPLEVKIEDPNVSPGTCPLLDLFGTGLEVQRG